MENAEKIIVGIDPGTNVTGYAVISSGKMKLELIEMGTIQLSKYGSHHKKLTVLFNKVYALIQRHNPHEFAIEAPFYAKNAQSLIKLGRAQGVAIAATMTMNIPVFEYSPKKAKQSITGNGNASKEQMAEMLKRTLKLEKLTDQLDATDALGIAVCHHYQRNNPLADVSGKGNSWKKFIQDNPERVKS